MKYRMSFSKDETLKFISHLDLRRAFTRAVRRSRLPVEYTQGFNPHPDLVFSPPLSVGYTSRCELIDLGMTEDIPPETVISSLNSALPPGIRIISVWTPVKKISEIMYSSYDLTLNIGDSESGFLEKSLRSDRLKAIKKTKTSEYEISLNEHIVDFSVSDKGPESVVLHITLPSGNELSINPRLVTDVVGTISGVPFETVKTERTGIFDRDLNPFR